MDRRQDTSRAGATRPRPAAGRPRPSGGTTRGRRPHDRGAQPGLRERVATSVVVGVVVAAVAIGAIGYLATRGQRLGPVPVARVTATYPVERDGGVVTAGHPDAPAVIDAYLDFLCPGCRQFEDAYAEQVTTHLQAGDLRVRYHLLPMLGQASDPPGYSLEAANAAACAADAGVFPSYLASLFAGQPDEGGPGYTSGQLVELGRKLGATGPAFQRCVRDGRHDDDVRAAFTAARARPIMQVSQGGRTFFRGTPTITVGNRVIDYTHPTWLEEVIAGRTRHR